MTARRRRLLGGHKIVAGVFLREDNDLGCPNQGVLSMCNYSLHHVASRPAKVGDKLVTTQFNNSITRGFAAVGEPNVAVCLLPGTEVAFEKEIEFERGFAILLSLRWEREKGDWRQGSPLSAGERRQTERASRCARIP